MRLAALSLLLPTLALGQGQVGASVQTSSLLVGGPPAAAGVAFYVRPDGGIVLLAADTSSASNEGLQAFDLNGTFLEARSLGPQLAIDVRYGYGFPTKRDVILAVDSSGNIGLVGPDHVPGLVLGALATDGTGMVNTLHQTASAALGWHGGVLFAYLGGFDGRLDQWSIVPVSDESVMLKHVASVSVGQAQAINAIVADEQTDSLFLSVDSSGVLRTALQLDAGSDAFAFLDAGVLTPFSGLALYQQTDGGALLLASDRPNGLIDVFERSGKFRGSFKVVTDGGIQGVTGPVGLATLNVDGGPAFSQGVFAVVDANDAAGPLVKLVPWQKIAATFSPPLPVDTAFDVRNVPHAAPVPMMTCDAGLTDGGDDGGTDAGMASCGAGGGGGSSAGGGTGGTGGSHIPPTMGMPYNPKGCGCEGSGGALLGGLWLLGLALRRRLEVSRSQRLRS